MDERGRQIMATQVRRQPARNRNVLHIFTQIRQRWPVASAQESRKSWFRTGLHSTCSYLMKLAVSSGELGAQLSLGVQRSGLLEIASDYCGRKALVSGHNPKRSRNDSRSRVAGHEARFCAHNRVRMADLLYILEY